MGAGEGLGQVGGTDDQFSVEELHNVTMSHRTGIRKQIGATRAPGGDALQDWSGPADYPISWVSRPWGTSTRSSTAGSSSSWKAGIYAVARPRQRRTDGGRQRNR